MDTSTDFLVVLLSVGMSVVLLFTIIALYYTTKILKSVRSITEKAENIADNVDHVGEFFKKSAGPAAVAKIIANIVESVKTKADKGDK